VNSEVEAGESWSCQICGRETPCDGCAEHGPIVATRAGLNHVFAWHEDGTGWASYDWAGVRRRRPIQLRGGRDGGVVPVDRGERRRQIVRELAPIYPMVESERRGPNRLPIEKIAARVGWLVKNEGLKRSEAFDKAARESDWSAETIRSRYWRNRTSESPGDSDDRPLPWAEIVEELNRLRQARRPTRNRLVAYAVPLEDIVEVAVTVRDRYSVDIDTSAKMVAYVVDWPASAINLVLDACHERAPTTSDRA
jgi:hypothetical protein